MSVILYPFDVHSGTSVLDASGNAIDATITASGDSAHESDAEGGGYANSNNDSAIISTGSLNSTAADTAFGGGSTALFIGFVTNIAALVASRKSVVVAMGNRATPCVWVLVNESGSGFIVHAAMGGSGGEVPDNYRISETTGDADDLLGRHTFHAKYDTTQASAGDRGVFWVDGVVNSEIFEPNQNDEFTLPSGSQLDLTAWHEGTSSGTLDQLDGSIRQFEINTTDSQDVEDLAAALLLDDDGEAEEPDPVEVPLGWFDPEFDATANFDPEFTAAGMFDAELIHPDGDVAGTVAATVAELTLAATGIVANPVTSTVAATVGELTAAATALETIPSVVIAAQDGLTASATGVVANPVTSTVGVTLEELAAAATLLETIPSTVVVTMPEVVVAATASEAIPSVVIVTLPELTVAITASEAITSVVVADMPGLTAAATCSQAITATAACVVAELTGAATLSETIPCTVVVELPELAGFYAVALAGAETTCTIAAEVAELTAAATCNVLNPITSTMAADVAGLTASATASERIPCAVVAEVAGLTCAATASQAITAAVSASCAGLTAEATVTLQVTSAVACTMGGLTASYSCLMAEPITCAVAVVLPELTVAYLATVLQPGVTVATPHALVRPLTMSYPAEVSDGDAEVATLVRPLTVHLTSVVQQ